MPLFFFDVRTPQGLQSDETALELESAEVAYLEAYRAILDLTADLLQMKESPTGYAFEIADEAGRVVWRIPFNEPFD